MQKRKPLKRLEAGLPAAWYRDPDHYQRELEAFWYARWIAVCREEELLGPGDWKVCNLGTQSIFITRNSKQELKAFHNV